MKRRAAHRPVHERGLTLVETLVGLVVMSLLATVLFNALNLASRSWERAEKRAVTSEHLLVITQFLQRELSQSLPVSRFEDDRRRLLFKGTRRSLQFVSQIPSHRGGPHALYLLRLEARKGDAGYRLEFSYHPIGAEFSDASELGTAQDDAKVLLEGLTRVRFEYFGRPPNRETPVWRDRWGIPNALPRLVRISLDHAGPSDPWPAILIPIRSEAYADQPQLAFDTNGGRDE